MSLDPVASHGMKVFQFQEGFVEALIPQSGGTNGHVRSKKQRLKGVKFNIANLIRSLAEP